MEDVRHVVHDDRAALGVAGLAPEAVQDRADEEVALRVDAERVMESSGAADQVRQALLELADLPRVVRPVDLHGPLHPGAPPLPRLTLAVGFGLTKRKKARIFASRTATASGSSNPVR